MKTPTYGWQGAKHKSVGFVQNVQDKDNLIVSFCSGEARVLANEVIKVIPLDRGQHVQLKPDVKEPRYDVNLLVRSLFIDMFLFIMLSFKQFLRIWVGVNISWCKYGSFC